MAGSKLQYFRYVNIRLSGWKFIGIPLNERIIIVIFGLNGISINRRLCMFFIRNSIRTRNDAHLMAISIGIFHFRINLRRLSLLSHGSIVWVQRQPHNQWISAIRVKRDQTIMRCVCVCVCNHAHGNHTLRLEYMFVSLITLFTYQSGGFFLCVFVVFWFWFINSCWTIVCRLCVGCVLRKAASSFDMESIAFDCFVFVGHFHLNNTKGNKYNLRISKFN